MRLKQRLTLRDIFLVPLILFIATGVGLVTALLGSGLWDITSWIGLLAPILVIAWAWNRRD